MTTRRKFIIDAVEYYKRNNAEEYSKFLDVIQYKRNQLADPKFAKLRGITEARQLGQIPKKLSDQFYYVLDGVSEKRFLEKEGETKWFFTKFPEFLIPDKI
jgi:hypothetical protein